MLHSELTVWLYCIKKSLYRRITFMQTLYITAVLLFDSQPKVSVVPTFWAAFDTTSPDQLLFEVINWGLFKRFTSNGTILHSQAVVFRHPNQMHYLSPNTTDGKITTSHIHCILPSQGVCVPYARINFKFYDDVARSQNSFFSTPDIRNMNVVDERFFEIIRMPDGKARFRSILNPEFYLAVARFSSLDYQLVVTHLTPQLSSLFQYDFNHSIRSEYLLL
ncbi:hypothetical protein EB796_015548 [Bugula neritina]|uniref:Uncharacterized protein n=1 Tax=Bugula neritina TaxID=10212 RepID=A0A7J7JJC5_BUGNE|nr:hypothetical protein EB796_015548 [Bugula neritina]